MCGTVTDICMRLRVDTRLIAECAPIQRSGKLTAYIPEYESQLVPGADRACKNCPERTGRAKIARSGQGVQKLPEADRACI